VPLCFIAREARKHVKVVLSGEGADELFGGYNIYREPLSLAAFEKLPAGMRRALGALSPAARRHARQGPAAPRLDPAGAAVLRQRPDLPGRRAGLPERRDPDLSHVAVTAELYRAHPRRPATTTSPRCSTWTCSPGCAATSWSRPTR
jgi:asparagine synthase (glutamine-hydrolysing)